MIANGLDFFLEVSGGERFDFSGRETDEFGCRAYVTADELSWGTPDGEGARQVQFKLSVDGPSLDAVAATEGRLWGASGGRALIGWVPDRTSEPIGYDIASWRLEHEYANHEPTTLRRAYRVTAETANPYPRALEETLSPVMEAPEPPTGPYTPVLIHDCLSTGGWVASPGPVQQSAQWVYSAFTQPSGGAAGGGGSSWVNNRVDMRLTVSGMDFSSTPYLVVEWQIRVPGGGRRFMAPDVYVGADLTPHRPVHHEWLAEDWMRSTYALTGYGSAPRLLFRSDRSWTHPQRLLIRSVHRSQMIPAAAGAGHQMTRTITVEGSAPTEASLHMWHGGDKLGEVLVHTSSTPDGMIDLDPHLTSAAGTAASGTVSGTLKSLGSPVTWRVPIGLFDPSRSTTYMLVARMQRTPDAPIVATTSAVIDAGADGGSWAGEERTVAPEQMDALGFVTLGVLTLPPRMLDGDDAYVGVSIATPDATGAPVLDDAWLIDVEAGALTAVDAAGVRHLWIDSPTLDHPLPQVWGAIDEDGTNRRALDPWSWGRHEWLPGEVYVTTVATGVLGSSIQAGYFRRGHTHIARPGV